MVDETSLIQGGDSAICIRSGVGAILSMCEPCTLQDNLYAFTNRVF
jgi:hypothetical protein